jgi:predicted glycoside hydrolase/deacetylase ChbG (UPF0249 family)
MSPGLLIIAADDWGLTPEATDAILACMQAGRVSSTSAMVQMTDSARAAKLAQRHGLPVGLHLNLTVPYTAYAVSPDVRNRQERLTRFFRRNRWATWTYNPSVVAEVRACVRDQLEAFRTTYGHEPSHIDGHHHVHTSPNVLLSGSFARGLRLRRTFTFLADEKPWPNRLPRRTLNRVMARRFVGTDYFFHFQTFVRAVQDQLVRFDDSTSVEVLTHPEWESEQRVLMSDVWPRLISPFTVGSYDLLSNRLGPP